MKAAHLVPKSLQSDELAYLFGAGNMDLSDPKNGRIQILFLVPFCLRDPIYRYFFIINCKIHIKPLQLNSNAKVLLKNRDFDSQEN